LAARHGVPLLRAPATLAVLRGATSPAQRTHAFAARVPRCPAKDALSASQPKERVGPRRAPCRAAFQGHRGRRAVTCAAAWLLLCAAGQEETVRHAGVRARRSPAAPTGPCVGKAQNSSRPPASLPMLTACAQGLPR
jgi:hypothetical protein